MNSHSSFGNPFPVSSAASASASDPSAPSAPSSGNTDPTQNLRAESADGVVASALPGGSDQASISSIPGGIANAASTMNESVAPEVRVANTTLFGSGNNTKNATDILVTENDHSSAGFVIVRSIASVAVGVVFALVFA